jgi:HlyD family secretion protein
VDEAKATVTADEKAVTDTKLYAPASGMIASLSSDSIGQTVSSGNSSSAAASQSQDSAASSSGSTGSSSSSGFAELVNDRTMTMTVSISEDDISSVKVGQTATVSITALTGVELAGRVSSISPLGSDSSGVVSYDATVTVTQSNPEVLPGMSATATIVTDQAQGVTVPNQAINGSGSDASVELVQGGKTVSTPVVVGLKGSSRSQIVSGLKAGDEVKVTITLPALGTSTTSSSSSSSSTGGFGGRFGGAGGFAGAGGGGLRAFFNGGGAG